MTADVELLPCPWCGAKLSNLRVSEGSTFRWRKVDGCCADGPEVRHDTMADDQAAAEAESRTKAIDAWNGRAKDAEVEAMRTEVERWKVPFLEWLDKTEWVQQTVKPGELGHHRADVMRLRLEQAEAHAKRLAEALRSAEALAACCMAIDGYSRRELRDIAEETLPHWQAALHPTAAQEAGHE